MSSSNNYRSDAELIQASVLDASAFRELYERHAERVLAYFYRRTFDAHVSADLTAETFAVALEKRSKFKDIGRPGAAWLFGIAAKELSRYRRTWGIERRALARIGVDPPALSDESIERIESLVDVVTYRELLVGALTQLNSRQREALQMRVIDGLDYRAVGKRIGCSEGAARVVVHRALAHMAESMEARK